MVGVEDDRLRLFELVLKRPGESLIPPLTHAGRVEHRLFFDVVVVVIEVLRLQDFEVEIIELDFVSSEVLSTSRLGQSANDHQCQRGAEYRPRHIPRELRQVHRHHRLV